MKKLLRTVALSLSCAETMPYARPMTSVGSSTIGNRTSTPNRSLIILSHAKCENRLSTESAINAQSRPSNCAASLANATNSVVQTGVKSAGCENRSEEHTSELQSLMRNPYAVSTL